MESSIRLRDVHVEFPIYQGGSRSLKKSLIWRGTGGAVASDAANRVYVKALDGISLDLLHGARVGLIGHNGAGKTTLLRVLAGVYEPTRGRIEVKGKISPLFDIGLGMDWDATGYDNILLRGLHLGLRRREIAAMMEGIAEFTELGPYLEMPVRTYSAGMMIRLTFAVSTAVAPEILLIDEGILAGDAHFLEKATRRVQEFVGGSSILVFASHSQEFLRAWCETGIYLRAGRIVQVGAVADVLQTYNRDVAAPPRPV